MLFAPLAEADTRRPADDSIQVMRIAISVLLLVSSLAAADNAGKAVVVTDTAIVLREPIYFETAKPVLKSESFPLLDALATTIKGDKHLALVEIQGHTDARGNDDWNLAISEKRAQAVYKYLVAKGVDAKRLRAKGYGETKPLDKGANPKAWAKNRRIDFVILQRIH